MSSKENPAGETEFRVQVFKTMKSLERMADAVTASLLVNSKPKEKSEDAPYKDGNIHADCRACDGVVVFEAFVRQPHQAEDTCNCSVVGLDNLAVPKKVRKAIWQRSSAAIKKGSIVACSAPPTAPLDSDLKEIREQLDKHRKALAIIGSYANFEKVFFGLNPDRAVHDLVKLKSCSCIGTGWVARDESCSKCGMKGYIES